MRQSEVKLNEPRVTRAYFAQVKYAEYDGQDLNLQRNAENMVGDIVIPAENTVEAISFVDRRYKQNDVESAWVHYEIFEEETTVVRRRVFVAERRREQIQALVERHNERLLAAEASNQVTPATTNVPPEVLYFARPKEKKRYKFFGWFNR